MRMCVSRRDSFRGSVSLPASILNSGHYVDVPPAPLPVDAGAPPPPPLPDSSCSFQLAHGGFHDSQQHFGDVMLPGDGSSCVNGGGYGSCVPSPVTWSHGLSSDADYYGHGIVGSTPGHRHRVIDADLITTIKITVQWDFIGTCR